MVDAAKLVRFRCPQCRSRSMIDTADQPGPYVCPQCGAELEGREQQTTANTQTDNAALKLAEEPSGPADNIRQAIEPHSLASGPRELDYLRKIHFWVRWIGIVLTIVMALMVMRLLVR